MLDELAEKLASIYDQATLNPDTNLWELVDRAGYVRLYNEQPTPRIWTKYRYQHRDVMEQKLKRALALQEIVHHINGVRTDNRPENLELVLDHLTHIREKHPQWRAGIGLAEPPLE